MEEDGEVENRGVLETLEQVSIFLKAWLIRVDEFIEFLDANECVFISGIPVKKLMLDEAGEFAELGNVLSEEIHFVH